MKLFRVGVRWTWFAIVNNVSDNCTVTVMLDVRQYVAQTNARLSLGTFKVKRVLIPRWWFKVKEELVRV